MGDFERRAESGTPLLSGGALIALGTNMPFGDLAGPGLLEAALSAIGDAGVKVLKQSNFWTSPAWPPPHAGEGVQPDFVNAVALTELGPGGPDELYAVLAGIERTFGRKRRERWGPRTLDLDIVDFAGLVRTGGAGELTLPHPEAHERPFVLAPLAEIAPDWRHPVWRKTAAALLAELDSAGLRRL
jgi:2-amino-4-hydroxy-6-hydroxymethyldihydropteridine diphosphokinase